MVLLPQFMRFLIDHPELRSRERVSSLFSSSFYFCSMVADYGGLKTSGQPFAS